MSDSQVTTAVEAEVPVDVGEEKDELARRLVNQLRTARTTSALLAAMAPRREATFAIDLRWRIVDLLNDVETAITPDTFATSCRCCDVDRPGGGR